jgi:hypothetical protein
LSEGTAGEHALYEQLTASTAAQRRLEGLNISSCRLIEDLELELAQARKREEAIKTVFAQNYDKKT